MKKTVLPLAAFAALFSPLAAQNITLEALTVTSSPLGDTELDAADSVEIYTAEDIEKAHVQSLYEFINYQTSVFAMPSFGNPMAQKLDLHGYGIENGYENIVVTVNGRRLNNIDMIPQLLSAIAPEDIERLEIVKGGGIVLGGDGANAGAINIVTKNDASKDISFYGGVYNTYDGAFRVGHSDDLFTVSASGEAYHTDGTRHIDAEQNRDAQKLADGTFALSLTPTDSLELHLGLSTARTDVSYGSSLTLDEYESNPAQPGANPTPAYQKFDADAYSAGMTYFPVDSLSISLDGSIEKKKMDSDSPSYFYESVTNYDYRSAKVLVDYADAGLHLTFGGDVFDGTRKMSSTYYGFSSDNKTSKKNLAGFTLAQYRTGKHTFKAGYRYENVSYDFSDANSSSDNLYGAEAGYNYKLSPERSLFVSYAHAFQTPDIDRFYNSYNYVTYFGMINPMTSDTVTAGYTSVTATNKLKLSLYYAAIKNEIYYYSDPDSGTWANTNIDRSHKYGVDFYDKWLVTGQFALSLNYNYVQAIIDDEVQNGEDFSGNELPGVSNHSVKAAMTVMPTDALTLTLSHTYRSSAYAMNDIGNNFAQKQQVYNSTDLSLNYTRTSYTLFARINNMFNNANGLWVQNNAIYPVNFTTTAIAGATLKF